ncbi:MAG: putative Ig domain-containing protein [Woeseiaceae bacterium]|nr:putative Ig domain-containing protein [Woeseiaceae bacterium]
MVNNLLARFFRHSAIVLLTSLALAGCLPQGEVDPPADDGGDDNPGGGQTHVISGSVGDGPISGADVNVHSAAGTLLGTVASNSDAEFDIQVETVDTDYPLSLLAIGGTDLVTMTNPDFDLKSLVGSVSDTSIANLNPFTTVAYEAAVDMSGGMTAANMDSALQIVFVELNSGLSSLSGGGTMRAQVDETNIAELMRASEALGEVVRRTRNALGAVGRSISGNGVVVALGSDLADGLLDGRGGARTDSRVSAVAGIAMAQVALEAMQNRLRVQGSDGMARIEDAMSQVFAGTPNPTLDQLPLTPDMLSGLRDGLAAAAMLQTSTLFGALLQETDALQPGMTAASIRQALSVDITAAFDALLITVAGASSNDIDAVNDVLRTGDAPDTNTAPVITGTPASTVAADTQYSFVPNASDSDGDPLTFSISGKPTWASFDTSSGALSGTPQAADAGTSSGIVISVTDGQASDSLPSFSITVTTADTNSPPTISGNPPGAVVVGSAYGFTPTAGDADGDTLTFSISNRPSWASFSTSNGQLSGTPTANDVGTTNNIVISVSDGEDTASLGAFSIVVNAEPGNSAPQISGNPQTTVTAGESYSFTPSASDADGDTLTFSISNKPSWASFSTSAGQLSGSPTDNDVGTTSNIVISVSDGEDSASLAAFSITVEAQPANTPPEISGNPPTTVVEGYAYDFQPSASDDDGDSLAFSVSNKPSWASFDTGSGRLSGTPGAGDVGTYTGVSISVSDGEDSATLGPFDISVEAIVLGSATLSWEAPTQNTDGTALTDLAGYRLYWGTSSGNYSNSVTINDTGITTYVVDNLAPGTWVFVSTAINEAGVESDFSNEATKTIQQ